MIQPEDSICFLVNEVVGSLDFKKLDEKYDGPGHPAYDPRIIVKLHVQGAIDGQRSSRKIAKNARTNIIYMYHAGQTTPDFRTISDFRKDNPEIIKEAFKKTFELANRMNITNLGHLSIDGTKLKANASNSKTLKREALEDIDNYIKNFIEEGIAMDDEEDASYGKSNTVDDLPDDVNTVEKMKEKIKELREKEIDESEKTEEKEILENNQDTPDEKKEKKRKTLAEKIKERFKKSNKKEREKIKEKVEKAKQEMDKSGKDVVSWTDPESRFMKNKEDVIEYSFNPQIVVESGAGIIVANDVTQDYNDVCQFEPMIENAEKNIGELQEGTEVSVDNGYYSGKNIRCADENGLDLYVPDRGQAQEMKGGKMEQNPYDKDNFIYDEENDVFVCPANGEMVFWHGFKDRTGVLKRIYRGTSCEGCPFKDKCTTGKFRTITVDEYWKDRLKMKEKMSTKEGKEKYKIRGKIAERPFGDIKQNQGFREFLTRSLNKVKIEFNLACSAHNLKRIWSFIRNEKFSLEMIRGFLGGSCGSA
jgi:transposase